MPALAIITLIASGRLGTLAASFVGLLVALVVTLSSAPHEFLAAHAAVSLLRGIWIGWNVLPYILGGLLFWQMAIRPGNAAMPVDGGPGDPRARRRLLFSACFLIGPFAESATGFGIGIIGTIVLIRRLDLPPVYLICFALLSQTMILWGGMGSSSIIAAALARADPTTLAVNASLFLVVFNILWLPLYWRMADKVGIAADPRECASEAAWLGLCLVSVVAATAVLGPETAMLASYGPIIVLRYLVDERPDRRTLARSVQRMMPFVVLIGWLVATRLFAPLTHVLEQAIRIAPFAGLPAWSPLFHAGTWLIVGAVLTGLLRGDAAIFGAEIRSAWKTGRLAIVTVMTFAMMAELLTGSGVAEGLATGMASALGAWAVVLTPQLSAIFGALANSGNAANGLFMSSQVNLAISTGLNVKAVVALQQAAAQSLNMISPVRMSIVCGMAGTPGREREAYRTMFPFGIATVVVTLIGSLLIALKII
ncbi:L-lactate permease [Aurantiacibacter xanthus]|nr:L-lactate permease [Aurantiacibacter xanthus]